MRINCGTKCLIQKAVFTVIGESGTKSGYLVLQGEASRSFRNSKTMVIELPEEKVQQGIEDYEVENIIRNCCRVESPEKTALRQRFLPRRMGDDLDDEQTE